MSGLSFPHLLLLMLIIFLVFGTSKLKNLGKDLGGAIKGFKESMREGEQEPPAQAQQAPQQLQQKPPIEGSATPVPPRKDNV